MLAGPANTPRVVTCGQVFPNDVASSGSCQWVADCGGIQRNSPVGGAAYGMPLNSYTPLFMSPRTGPSAVWTTGPSVSPAVTGVDASPTTRTALHRVLVPHRLFRCRSIGFGSFLGRFPSVSFLWWAAGPDVFVTNTLTNPTKKLTIFLVNRSSSNLA